MDDLIKSIKKKLSTNNLVEMMRDAKVIDDKHIKEEDVRKTLEKIDPNNLVDADEIAAKLNEISEEAAKEKTKPKKSSVESSGVFTVLSKGIAGNNKKTKGDDEEDFASVDNAPGFLD